MSKEIEWVATVGCEGGPVLVVDLPGFGQWTGAAPFAELRKVNELGAERFANRMSTLHFWGGLMDELPAPFASDEGDANVACATEDEARAKLAALREAVKK